MELRPCLGQIKGERFNLGGCRNMKLIKLNISNFGLFHNKRIEFSPGLNLIYGENESGKSTVHSFIKGMLFGIEKTRGRPTFNDMYDKYQPWDRPGSYDGSMEFEINKNKYHLYRNFDRNNKAMDLTYIDTGRELNLSQIEFQDLIGGITQTGYDGTISIGQLKAKTDEDLVYVVQNHIMNLSMTKTEEIDVKGALEILQGEGKKYDLRPLKEEIEEIENKIKEGEQRELRLDNATDQLRRILRQEEDLLKTKESLLNNKYYATEDLKRLFIKFPVIKTKYGYYLDRLDQGKELEININSTKDKILVDEEKVESSLSTIKNSIERIEEDKQEYSAIDKEKYSLKDTEEVIIEKTRRRNFNLLIPFLLVGLILILMNYSKNDFFFYTGFFILASGFLVFTILQTSLYKTKKAYLAVIEGMSQRQDIIKENIQDILKINEVKQEKELRDKHDTYIKKQLMIEQLYKDLKNYQNQDLILQEKIKNHKEELLQYIKKFHFIYEKDQGNNLELNDETIGILDEYITDEKAKLNHYEENIKPELRDIAIRKEKISWEIELLEENEEELLENKEKYQELVIKKESYEKEIKSIDLAIKTIKSLSIDIHHNFGADLNDLVSSAIRKITKGKYLDLKVDEKLRIKTEIKDQYQHLERLSTGTMDQFYLSLRLAIADLIYKEEKVPILLDDTFANYDDKRLHSTLEFLSRNFDRQILLFTCHKREKEILDSIGTTYNYIKL